MKRTVITSLLISFGLIALLAVPGLLDNLIVFFLVGRLPFSEVSLPPVSMLIMYIVLLAVSIRAILRIGSDYNDKQIAKIVDIKKSAKSKSSKSTNSTATKRAATNKTIPRPTAKRRRYQTITE